MVTLGDKAAKEMARRVVTPYERWWAAGQALVLGRLIGEAFGHLIP